MTRPLPGKPPKDDRIPPVALDLSQMLADAVSHGVDVAELLVLTIAYAAARAGGTEQLLRNNPDHTAAKHVRDIMRTRVGWYDERLYEYAPPAPPLAESCPLPAVER